MPKDVLERAFDPFFTTKPTGQGTGLGLSMVYGFAGQSNGAARIKSELRQGTVVTIYLPHYNGPLAAEQDDVRTENAPTVASGRTVLVVDDEALVRMVAVETLEDLGYRVLEADDSPSALRLLASDVAIDLLVTDVGLPNGMNGRQLADAARVNRPDLPVLFVTGYAENAVLNHGQLDVGMHIMTKPFLTDALARRVEQLLSHGQTLQSDERK
jgi:CheY-like chemotaxis protein